MSRRLSSWTTELDASAGDRSEPVALLHRWEAVGKRFGGMDISNGDEERAQAIALRRHAEG